VLALRTTLPRTGDYLFPGQAPGKHLSNMVMAMTLRRMEELDCTVHGFRSSFRDWCGECTKFPREIAEHALAHRVGSEVERAYRREDALAKRRELMDQWSAYLGSAKS
jgi:integrase